jgi:hypothetical protein
MNYNSFIVTQKKMSGGLTATAIIAFLWWSTYFIFFVFSALELQGIQKITPGEYVVSFGSIVGGLGVMAFFITIVSPSEIKKKGTAMDDIMKRGSPYVPAVYPVVIFGVAALAMVIVVGSIVTHTLGFYTVVDLTIPIGILDPASLWLGFNAMACVLLGVEFFFGIQALFTYYWCINNVYKKGKAEAENTYYVMEEPLYQGTGSGYDY